MNEKEVKNADIIPKRIFENTLSKDQMDDSSHILRLNSSNYLTFSLKAFFLILIF